MFPLRHLRSEFWSHPTGLPPVVIPAFNNPTYCRGMIAQLRTLGLRNIVILDNASDLPAMVSFLREVEGEARIVRLRRNMGPKVFARNPLIYRALPEIFCVTDPDLRFSAALPPDWLDVLKGMTDRFGMGKAGFALDISAPERFIDRTVRFQGRDWRIEEWEAQFWRERLGETTGGDPIFRGDIDTTFAVYNKRHFDPGKGFYRAVRVAGRFTCQHIPWYRDESLPPVEDAHYRKSQRHSWYAGEGPDGR
ncbi:glycosyltransferase family A protein [Neoroseomonas rubea]|uniref:glycosyltransferase family A protein n=1 Tax=Neoroseomonas rubea TaxID=2748666 RepID=UPI0018DF0ECC|nr:glycosyltransferase family A protein [Roseomonas rubea]